MCWINERMHIFFGNFPLKNILQIVSIVKYVCLLHGFYLHIILVLFTGTMICLGIFTIGYLVYFFTSITNATVAIASATCYYNP